MTIRRILLSTAIAGGALLFSTAPAFAQGSGGSSGGGDSTLPETGASGDSQNALLVIGAGGIIAGASVVLVRRRSGARA